MILCQDCDRGGNGNAVDKCSCGWKVTKSDTLGCFLGVAIVGERRKNPKVSRARQRYERYLEVGDVFDSFRDFLLHEEHMKKGGGA